MEHKPQNMRESLGGLLCLALYAFLTWAVIFHVLHILIAVSLAALCHAAWIALWQWGKIAGR